MSLGPAALVLALSVTTTSTGAAPIAGPSVDALPLGPWSELGRGELWALARARLRAYEAGVDVHLGEPALLHELSRLGRCLPLGPIPADEAPLWRALRHLVRAERVQLERVSRDAWAPRGPLAALLRGHHVATATPTVPASEIAWPTEPERWPDEESWPSLEPSRCRPPSGVVASESDARRRRAAESAELHAAAELLEQLPPALSGPLAVRVLADARARGEGPSPALRARVERALPRLDPPWRSRARLLLALGTSSSASGLERLNAVLEDGSATPLELGLTRVRLAAAAEPDWPRVLTLAAPLDEARPEERRALAHARARAWFATGRWTELRAFARRWRRSPDADGPTPEARALADLFERLALELPLDEAIAWTSELAGRGQRAAALERMGRRALAERRFAHAEAAFEALRAEAEAARPQRGPLAVADRVRWDAERARVAFEADDLAGFAGLLDAVVAPGRDPESAPIARSAPHRELARLCQDLLGRLTEQVASRPERRAYAGALLEAVAALSDGKSRWHRLIARQRPALVELAGPWAAGRAPRPAKGARRLRSLGEVVLPRLPPSVPPPEPPPLGLEPETWAPVRTTGTGAEASWRLWPVWRGWSAR